MSTKLERSLFSSVEERVRADGFRLLRDRGSFVRRVDEKVTHVFQLVCPDARPGLHAQPNVAVRIEQIEQIFHRTSGFPVAARAFTPTIGGSVGNIQHGSNAACEHLMETDADIPTAADWVLGVFNDFALRYFDAYSSLSAIDAVLNDSPTERCPHRGAPWLRCSTGAIVAKLAGRADYAKIVQIYEATLARANKGFYLKFFHPLLADLERIPAGSGLA